MSRRLPTATLSLAFGVSLLLGTGPGALADSIGTSTQGTAPQAPASGSSGAPEPASSSPQAASSPTTTTTTGSASSGTTTAGEAPVSAAPEVQAQRSQPRSVASPPHASKAAGISKGSATTEGTHSPAPSPAFPAPPPPGALGTSVSSVPSFFIDSFSIPPFLLPIYQAAGSAYGIPWQVLAAINEVETDYGRDLSVSSAGAEGWMQFLPSTWGRYGLDVNNSGFEDPYNPADAIFAAARYLRDAGGASDIRAAIFAYNHSAAYVNSVMLRAQLISGAPPSLLGAMTTLAEARFPVHAPSHFSDGFPATGGPSPHQIPATTIYSQADAPVIAVQNGRITRIGDSAALGRHVSLTDANGNTYTYAELGTIASLYPVLEGHGKFSLHTLHKGVHVIAGTVLGHLAVSAQPHLIFQIRPGGAGSQPIDPKPILDNWVKLRYSATVLSSQSTAFKSRLQRGQLTLPGAIRSLQVAGAARILKVRSRRRRGLGATARAAALLSWLSPDQWLSLIVRLGQIPDPEVASRPSQAAIPDNAGVSGTTTAGAH